MEIHGLTKEPSGSTRGDAVPHNITIATNLVLPADNHELAFYSLIIESNNAYE